MLIQNRYALSAMLLLLCSTATHANVPPQPATTEALNQPVKAFEIRPISTIAPFAAEVEASHHAKMAFRIPGQLQQMWVRMGDYVLEGQLLAELDPTDYQLALQARQAEFDLATIRATRDQQLFTQQLISEDQFDRSQTDMITAQARLRQAKVDLDDTILRAPFDGYVAYTMVKNGQVMAANSAIMTIENNDQLDVRFNLPVPYATPGQDALSHAQIRFGHLSQRHPGAAVKEFASQPDPDTNSYRITLTLPRPNNVNVLTGMNAWVELLPTSLEQPIALPAGALFNRQAQQAQVWKIDSNNRLQAVTITLDSNNKLLSGLRPGDRIVAAATKQLQPQQQVRVWQRERGI
ncbi:efflux RND transporter periplasmic adaptor subunit [uncultured Ferrimonas sp.]|uniref:efflux RND transporter periplasmic adaptor subunit n=1 Tax=uncultured Ferrimonas sp. TaxID=432640 RepID=UPI00263435CE|nr:efflux RND transporter periplasmic adaptor subunit [uncultured Ferrimonas sp.]